MQVGASELGRGRRVTGQLGLQTGYSKLLEVLPYFPANVIISMVHTVHHSTYSVW